MDIVRCVQFGIESVVFTIVSGWVMSMVVAESFSTRSRYEFIS